MSVVVQLTVKAKPESYQQLYDTWVAILPDTAKANGAMHISCAADPDNNEFRVWEIWEKIEDQKAYMQWRMDRGDIDKLGALLAEPPKVEELEHLVF